LLRSNIIVIDIDALGVATLRKELAASNPSTKFVGLTLDFNQIHQDNFFDPIDNAIKDLDISLLVNNVGMFPFGPFEQFDFNLVKRTTTVNIMPQVLMTHRVINKMLKRPENVRSGIITMSSMSSCVPVRYFQLYGATKLFNYAFSQALYDEYSDKIDVLAVRPGTIKTELTKSYDSYDTVSVEQVVKGALSSLGHSSETNGAFKHRVLSFMANYRWVHHYGYNKLNSWFSQQKEKKKVVQIPCCSCPH